MTAMQVLISVGGVALTVWLAWWLGGPVRPALSPAAAIAIADAALTGIDADDAVVDRAGRAALVMARDGRMVLLKAMGDHWAVRILGNAARGTATGGRLVVDVAEPLFGRVLLEIGPNEAARLAARLGPR
jgi:hypothetical protein